MKIGQACLLILNGGSSSVKFALYTANKPLSRLFHGKIDRIGLKDSTLTFNDEKSKQESIIQIEVSDYKSAATLLINRLEKLIDFSLIKGVGHRIVHGMHHTESERITPELIEELRLFTSYDPNHLANEIEIIETFLQYYPTLQQVACYDTAFHASMPRVAKLLPIPRRFDARGIQRFGFHGISYSYLMEVLTQIAGPKASKGRVILAHLGNGASMAAVCEGKSIDTSMGFTPAGGLPMGSRPGDLDPGVAWYIMQSEHLTPKEFNNLINHESGLLGISETSSDMRDLLAKEADDVRAREAIASFCYQAKKYIGSFSAVLGGLDTLVFAGGIGESCPEVRSHICEGLGFLGIELEGILNKANAPVISKYKSRVIVRVVHTNEEWMIAKIVSEIINPSK